MDKIPKFSVFEKNTFDANDAAKRLKAREIMNVRRFRAAQERGDNFAIKFYSLRIKLDKIDEEKNKIRNQIHQLKKKFKRGKDYGGE